MTVIKTRLFAAPGPGPLTVQVDAGRIDLYITARPDVATATATVTGPRRTVRRIRTRIDRDGTWWLSVPDPRGRDLTGTVVCAVAAPDGTAVTGPGTDDGVVTMTVLVPAGSVADTQTGVYRYRQTRLHR